ncbi:MAG TPA: peptidoglycan DD-metalloendopeptidase family protein [Candidatus Paceibacterota bacterium]
MEYFTKDLAKGSNDPDVVLLQKLLATDKDIYSDGSVTGFYGNKTEAAVIRFQLKYKVISKPTDGGAGRCGAKTRAKLREVFSNFPPITNEPFLVCPIQGNDPDGKVLNARTVKISAVIDHLDTAIDPLSKKNWGRSAKDQRVKAFNGEIGETESSATEPFGYTKKIPSPFFSKKEINYVGAYSKEDKYSSTFYLNYDGHAGYDFPYQKLNPVIAPAEGYLQKARNNDDTVYGQGWEIHHTFYINHNNGYSTWYRHCLGISDELESTIGLDYKKFCPVKQGQVIGYVGDFGAGNSAHLHFEVRDKMNKIIDPYAENLWIL